MLDLGASLGAIGGFWCCLHHSQRGCTQGIERLLGPQYFLFFPDFCTDVGTNFVNRCCVIGLKPPKRGLEPLRFCLLLCTEER